MIIKMLEWWRKSFEYVRLRFPITGTLLDNWSNLLLYTTSAKDYRKTKYECSRLFHWTSTYMWKDLLWMCLMNINEFFHMCHETKFLKQMRNWNEGMSERIILFLFFNYYYLATNKYWQLKKKKKKFWIYLNLESEYFQSRE